MDDSLAKESRSGVLVALINKMSYDGDYSPTTVI